MLWRIFYVVLHYFSPLPAKPCLTWKYFLKAQACSLIEKSSKVCTPKCNSDLFRTARKAPLKTLEVTHCEQGG
jgi:hypothetical protein